MMMQYRLSVIWRAAVIASGGLLAGCAGLDDPYQRDGTWRPEGLNDANIAAMVAHPNDLVAGVNDPVSPGQLSAAAVRRLLTDKVKPLPNVDVSGVLAQTQGTPQAMAPGAVGGDAQ